MTKTDFDPNIIHDTIINSWPYYVILSIFSLALPYYFPQLLPTDMNMTLIGGGLALIPLACATFLFWVLEKRFKKESKKE